MSLGFETGGVVVEAAIVSLGEKELLQAGEEVVAGEHCSVKRYCWSITLEVVEEEAAEVEELLVEVVQQREEGEAALQA